MYIQIVFKNHVVEFIPYCYYYCLSQYSMILGELDAANGFLHKAIRLAHQSHNKDAIIYTYSMVDLLSDLTLSHIEDIF